MMVSIVAYKLPQCNKVYYDTYESKETAKVVGESISEAYEIPVKVVTVDIGELGL